MINILRRDQRPRRRKADPTALERFVSEASKTFNSESAATANENL